MKTLLKHCSVIVCVCLLALTIGYSARAEQTDQSLYSYVMSVYDKSSIDITGVSKKLDELQSKYNLAQYNNLQAESFEAVKAYAESMEKEINTKIDDDVESYKTLQNSVVFKIENNLEDLTTMELSILNRQYQDYEDNIKDSLSDKTTMASMYSNPTYDRIDTESLELSIAEQEAILSYDSSNNNTDIGDLKMLRIPFDSTKRITSSAGYRSDPINGKVKYHNATDYGMPIGTELYSVFNGTVTLSGNTNNAYGNNIKIDCGNGIVLHYAHLDKCIVKVGDKVKQNQLIGLSGNTGRSTGPHLHLSLFYKGEVLDIERLFK